MTIAVSAMYMRLMSATPPENWIGRSLAIAAVKFRNINAGKTVDPTPANTKKYSDLPLKESPARLNCRKY